MTASTHENHADCSERTALLAFSFLMQETHELAHTSVGRLICGCWGARDFNVWGLCRECANEPPLTLLATFAGPAYSFAVIWMGYYMLTRASARAVVFGVLQAMILKNGILDEYWILGSPIIVTAWLFVSAGTFAIFGKHIAALLTEPRMSEGAQATH